jgi:hypothetical protein
MPLTIWVIPFTHGWLQTEPLQHLGIEGETWPEPILDGPFQF